MTSLSVVIPAWSGTPKLAAMTLALCEQVRPMCDELIVSDEGDYYDDLFQIADVYLQNFPRRGHAHNLAQGIKVASKQFVAVLDSDITITKGSLRDLCIPFLAGYGTWKQWPIYRELMGWCFVIDRTLIAKHPVATPEFEGLGEWIVDLFPYTRYVEGFEYSHPMNSSYGLMQELGGKTLGMIRHTEIAEDRHRARMAEDPIYRQGHEA